MEAKEIFEQLTPIFRQVLDNQALVLTPALSARDVAEWDSLSHIRLIVSVEEHFGIKFSLSRIAELQNVGEFVELIRTIL